MTFNYSLNEDITVGMANDIVKQLSLIQVQSKIEDQTLIIEECNDYSLKDAFILGVIVESMVNDTYEKSK
jgi:hypothetical protein